MFFYLPEMEKEREECSYLFVNQFQFLHMQCSFHLLAENKICCAAQTQTWRIIFKTSQRRKDGLLKLGEIAKIGFRENHILRKR